MKKSLLFLPIALISLASLTSCNQGEANEIKLTFGSYIDSTFTDLKYADLEAKINEEQSFILVTYPGADSTCSCWRVFEMIINQYVNANVEIIYGVDVYQIMGKNNDFNLSLSTSSPSISFFKKGQLVEQIAYSTKSPQKFYKDYVELGKLISSKTEEPEIIYVNESILDNSIKEKEDFVILHTYSSCPDCSYCIPNVVTPFANNNDLDEEIWIIDLNEIKSDATLWQNYKNKYNLSNANNNPFGYNNGYVPTAQAYKNGELVDASVYFNDTISLVNKSYVITDSFYTEERLSHISYATNIETNILMGLEIPSDQIMSYNDGEYIIWSQEYANVYHKPLLEAFLTKYTK